MDAKKQGKPKYIRLVRPYFDSDLAVNTCLEDIQEMVDKGYKFIMETHGEPNLKILTFELIDKQGKGVL